MLGNRKLILDTFCEVYDQLKPWSDGEFWDLAQHQVVPGAIYMIGRAQFNHNRDRIRQLIESDTIKVILSNPAEGSETLEMHCRQVHGCADLVLSNRMLLVGGGDMSADWPCLQYDSFLPKILDYEENITEIARMRDAPVSKPYKFLFMNGRFRAHRKFLIEKFKTTGLLEHSIWTCLESRSGEKSRFELIHDGKDLMLEHTPTKLLDPRYEVDRYVGNISNTFQNIFVKYELFGNEWGEIYLKAEPYQDTYFSMVTETVFDYPYSFRTEKIWKPIAMGHPFVVCANPGYLRDLRNLGFRTFGHVIDESYDLVENGQQRLERIADVVQDLCQQDLVSFQKECYNVCEHNQQQLAAMRHQVRNEFPDRFRHFIKKYRFDE
jgi:hypothetical protein